MSRLQSWLTFAILSAAVFMLYLLGIFEYLPFIGDQFSTGQGFVRLVILASLVLFFLIVARAIANLRNLTAEREAIEQASLIVDKPSQEDSDSSEVDFAELLAELPRDGLLASRVDLLTTHLDEHATTDEVCLLLARQSGLDNEYGELVFGSELVLLGLMNLIGMTGVFVLLSEVITGLIAAVKQAGEFRAQAAGLIPPLGSVIDIMVVVVILSGVARLLVRIPQRRQRLAVIAADELALHFISKSKLPSQRSMAAEESPSPLFVGLELSEAVERAFTMAAKVSDPDSPLQTAPFLAILARADTSGHWDRLELEVGDMSQL